MLIHLAFRRRGQSEFAHGWGLGKLGFAATALLWERPFLGPLYVWAEAVKGQKGKLVVPWALLVIMDWIAKRMEEGGSMEIVEEDPCGEEMVIYILMPKRRRKVHGSEVTF